MADDEKKVTNYSSITLMHLLGLLFIGLKLTNYIDWSWWWVLLPLYGPVLVLLLLGSGLMAIAGVMWTVGKLFGGK